MPNQKILYITTEMFPYQEESSMAEMVSKMALSMHGAGNDVRVFMPRFGTISERKFQLHEVIRLSGMNIIINDLDQPLIIKVASLPGERLQVYFIDNEEYFKRKAFYTDEEGNGYDDNGERAIFFARGVIETIKKLNWVPDVIHLNGWMSAMIPIYLKTFYKNDYYFKNTKLVISLFNEEDYALEEDFNAKMNFDQIEDFKAIEKPTFQDVVTQSLKYVDVVVKGDEFLDATLKSAFADTAAEKSEFLDSDSIKNIY